MAKKAKIIRCGLSTEGIRMAVIKLQAELTPAFHALFIP